MKEKPILFSGPMVRAILDERKTVTRRVIKPQPKWDESPGQDDEGNFCGRYQYLCGNPESPSVDVDVDVATPRYQPGDLLWVRETWSQDPRGGKMPNGEDMVYYRADMPDGVWDGYWKPSIFMPKWAARLWLRVLDVRPERAQGITEEDAVKEGVESREEFIRLWDSINGKRAPRESNPWVWRIEFIRADKEAKPCPKKP